MPCELDPSLIEKTVDFHGHWCPGLAIGLRAGEWALKEMGRAGDEDIVAVVETDMCGVDAIQVLTGCTVGKGNLVYRDQGKMAFSFFRRGDGKCARLVFNAQALGGGPDPRQQELTQKAAQGQASEEELAEMKSFREEWSRRIMDADLDQAFTVKAAGPAPRQARILVSLVCEDCGESTMESRTHRLAGRTLCRECFEALDKRI